MPEKNKLSDIIKEFGVNYTIDFDFYILSFYILRLDLNIYLQLSREEIILRRGMLEYILDDNFNIIDGDIMIRLHKVWLKKAVIRLEDYNKDYYNMIMNFNEKLNIINFKKNLEKLPKNKEKAKKVKI